MASIDGLLSDLPKVTAALGKNDMRTSQLSGLLRDLCDVLLNAYHSSNSITGPNRSPVAVITAGQVRVLRGHLFTKDIMEMAALKSNAELMESFGALGSVLVSLLKHVEGVSGTIKKDAWGCR